MRRGFSLIEMSIILLVFGGLAAASTMLGSKWVEGTEVQSAKMNIQTIEKAIAAYARINQRLPCPAPDSVASTDANFGKEAATPGTCTGATSASGQVMLGVVPFQTLGIGKSLAYDPWGNRIAYYVDMRMTAEDAMITHPASDAAIGDIEVDDIAGGMRTNKAVVALVSFGERAHGAKNRDGTTITNTNPSAKELENADVNTTGTSTGADKILVQAMPGKDPADNNDFDDIVSYKLRSQLLESDANAPQIRCPAQAVNWTEGAYSCAGSVGELADGESVIVSDLVLQDTGSVTVLCNGGSISLSNQDCEHTPVNCTATTQSWTVSATCNGNLPATTHGAVTPTITNTTGGRTGTATFTCSDGTFIENGGSVCGLNCAAGTANWNTGAYNCTQTYGALNHGANSTLTDSAPTDTGNVTVTCTNGAISQSGAACARTGCAAATLSWGSGCTANVAGPQSDGYSTGITNTAAGYDGTATASCTSGAWALSGTSCNAHCAAQTVNWIVSGQSCSASVGAINHGSSAAATDSVQNSTGSVTVTCNNGTLNQSGATCATQCPGNTASWTVSGQTCNSSYTDIADSASSTISDAAAPTTGSVTLSCANGVVSQSGATCAAAAVCPSPVGSVWIANVECSGANIYEWTGKTQAQCAALCQARPGTQCCEWNSGAPNNCRAQSGTGTTAHVGWYAAMCNGPAITCDPFDYSGTWSADTVGTFLGSNGTTGAACLSYCESLAAGYCEEDYDCNCCKAYSWGTGGQTGNRRGTLCH